MPFVVTSATGPGRVAVSRDAPGEMVVLPLHPQMEIDVREHAFLAATRDGVLRVVEGAGHVPSTERPDEFDEALRRFLDSIHW